MNDSLSDTLADSLAPADCDAGRFSCQRRQVLLGAGIGGVALVAAGCGSSSKASPAAAPTSDAGVGSGPASSGGAAVKGIIAVSDVPTDAAVSVKDPTGRTLLITQSGGKLTALDATCTHQGCTVAPAGKTLACPCHGSTFTVTGAVTGGPAPAPLHTVAVKDSGGQVVLA